MYGRTTSFHDHSVQCSQDHVAGSGGQQISDSMDSDLDDDGHNYHHFLHGMTEALPERSDDKNGVHHHVYIIQWDRLTWDCI